MTPDEIRAARHSLGMTHRQFGHAIGAETSPKAIDSAPAASGPRNHSTCCSALMLAFFAQLNSDPAALFQAIAAARDCEETK